MVSKDKHASSNAMIVIATTHEPRVTVMDKPLDQIPKILYLFFFSNKYSIAFKIPILPYS